MKNASLARSQHQKKSVTGNKQASDHLITVINRLQHARYEHFVVVSVCERLNISLEILPGSAVPVSYSWICYCTTSDL
jgi:hypothetical protein